MGARFWVRRFAQVFAGAFVLIGAAHLLRGRPVSAAAAQAGTWAAASAAVFTVSRYLQAKAGQHCAICRDTPEAAAAAKAEAVVTTDTVDEPWHCWRQ